MKKLLLLLAGCLFAGGAAFAQEEGDTETPAVTPGWVLKVHLSDPSGIPDVSYTMEDTGSQKEGETVYSVTFPVNVYPDQTKSTKFQYTITYTSEDEQQKSLETPWYTQAISDGNIEVTAAAWLDSNGNIVTTNSLADYLVCGGGSYTGYCYFAPSSVGGKITQYFNLASGYKVTGVRAGITAKTNNYIGSSNGVVTSNLMPSESTLPSAESPGIGIYSAILDYTTSSMTFEKSETISLNIDNAIPFVSPIEMSLPEGVELYLFDSIDGASLNVTLSDSETIPANTPVILKATEPGQYTFEVVSDQDYYYTVTTGSHNYINDVSVEGISEFKGVMQPHYAPVNSYVFNGTEFVKVTTTNSVLVNPFTSYLNPTDVSSESISIVFPEDEEETEDWSFSFDNNDSSFTSSDSEDGTNGTIALFTEDNATSVSFTIHAPSGVEKVFYAWVPTTEDNGDSDGDDDTTGDNGDEEDDDDDTTGDKGDSDDDDTTDNNGDEEEDEDVEQGNDEANVIRIARRVDTQNLDYQEADPVDGSDDNAFTINLYDITENSAKGTLYIATPASGSDQEQFNVQGTYNVSITRSVETGVETVEVSTIENNVIYNVFGQKVDETYKGIVIKNGKKYIQR